AVFGTAADYTPCGSGSICTVTLPVLVPTQPERITAASSSRANTDRLTTRLNTTFHLQSFSRPWPLFPSLATAYLSYAECFLCLFADLFRAGLSGYPRLPQGSLAHAQKSRGLWTRVSSRLVTVEIAGQECADVTATLNYTGSLGAAIPCAAKPIRG